MSEYNDGHAPIGGGYYNDGHAPISASGAHRRQGRVKGRGAMSEPLTDEERHDWLGAVTELKLELDACQATLQAKDAQIGDMQASLDGLDTVIQAKDEQIGRLVAACEAVEHHRAMKDEYHAQAAMGYPPKKEWGALSGDDVINAERDALDKVKAAIKEATDA